MSRNKDIKLLHEWTGWSYKECRKQMKNHSWNLYKALVFEEVKQAIIVKSILKALESIDDDQLLSVYVKVSEVKENE